ncbi:MAG: hypothetical protein PHY93_18860 [Bacteriovorax sp.]|nr:hypothetical protein [Bacteriovorax sp.]
MNSLEQQLKRNIVNELNKSGDDSIRAERLAKEVKALSEVSVLCEKIRLEIKQYQLDPNYSNLFSNLTQVNNQASKLHAYQKSRLPQKTKGKIRIPYNISFQVLKAIALCETYNQDLTWLNRFLHPTGELYNHLIDTYGSSTNIQLPVSSRDTRWLYTLKESLQRNLFCFTDKTIKKAKDFEYLESERIFYEMIGPLNKAIFDEYTAHLDEIIAKHGKN